MAELKWGVNQNKTAGKRSSLVGGGKGLETVVAVAAFGSEASEGQEQARAKASSKGRRRRKGASKLEEESFVLDR